jgi:DNA repair ATPase RecN
VVGKSVDGNRTSVEVRTLMPEERPGELAAMLTGEGAGEEARAAAVALLRGAAGPRIG